MPCVTGIVSGRPGFNPTSIYVGFVVKKVAVVHVFLQVLEFRLSVSMHQCSVLHSFINLRHKMLAIEASSSDTRTNKPVPTVAAPAPVCSSCGSLHFIAVSGVLFVREVLWHLYSNYVTRCSF